MGLLQKAYLTETLCKAHYASEKKSMTDKLKWKYFTLEVILCSIRWYRLAILSYANLCDILTKQRFLVNYSTIYRWFIEFAPSLLRKKLRCYQLIYIGTFWLLDKIYVKLKSKWCYFYQAINKQGDTLGSYFSRECNKGSTYQFFQTLPNKSGIGL